MTLQISTPEAANNIGKQMKITDALPAQQLHAFVTLNNQNSVLMSMTVKHKNKPGVVCLLHNNRIYAFELRKDCNNDSTSSDEQNVILNLLTTPKYRILSALYLIFRLLDNLTFLSIIVLSIYYNDFVMPTRGNIALLSALGFELFYDVVLFTNKYWILQRLSPYISLTMYFGYLTIIMCKGYVPNTKNSFSPTDFSFAISILSCRFFAFVMEEWVDVFIDAEIHNDLLAIKAVTKQRRETRLYIEEDNDENCQETSLCNTIQFQETDDSIIRINDLERNSKNIGDTWKRQSNALNESKGSCFSCKTTKIRKYLSILSVEMPQSVVYVGSLFAWFPYSVFIEDVWNREPFSKWARVALFPAILIFPAVIMFLAVGLMCLCALVILVLICLLITVFIYFPLGCCYKGLAPRNVWNQIANKQFVKELIHF